MSKVKIISGKSKNINVDLCYVIANSKFVTIFSKNLDIDISLDTKNLIEVLRKAGLIDEVK